MLVFIPCAPTFLLNLSLSSSYNLGKTPKIPLEFANSHIYPYCFRNYINTPSRKFSPKRDFIFKYMSFRTTSLTRLQINSEFADLNTLKQVCREAAVEGNFEYKTVKSDKKRYTISCKVDDCI